MVMINERELERNIELTSRRLIFSLAQSLASSFVKREFYIIVYGILIQSKNIPKSFLSTIYENS